MHYGLARRPFAVGNKRVALGAIALAALNRMTWKCGEVQETAMVLLAAGGHMKEKEWEAWVVGKVGKKG